MRLQHTILLVFTLLLLYACGGSKGGGNATIPSAPSGLIATTVSENRIDLAWDDNADNEDEFVIQRSLSSDSGFATLAIVDANNTKYTNVALTPATSYYYRVHASNSGGNSGFSNIATATTKMALFSMEQLQYAGAFRFPTNVFGISEVNYAVGTLTYNPDNHSLFIVGHTHHSAIAEFAIPEPGLATEVSELPVAGAPLQAFSAVLDTGGNPEEIDRITGMLWVNGSLLVNAEQWYDATGDNRDTSLMIMSANNLSDSRDGYFELDGAAHSAGYMGPIPVEWQQAFNAGFYTGWSSVYSITSRYSQGPSLWTFNPDDMITGSAAISPQITAIPFMNYAYEATHLSPRAVEYAPQGEPGPFPPADPIWNILSKAVYGFFVPGTRTFAVIGSTAGLDTGIGYKAEQDNGNVCGGPCAYGAADYYNYYWLFDVETILAAEEVFDPRPYDYGVWQLPFDADGAHEILGATFDPVTKTLFVSLSEAGQVEEFDRPPLIVTFTLK